jgi:hypothetical protein
LLNQDFERRFIEECRALRAPKVSVEFPGRRGQAARKKVLKAAVRLSDVLSEGEQKVIALADFLAETALRSASTPVVFDDPVNSLDHRRLEEVVTRIVKLSESRQVIVFTHNIWFATELLSRLKSAGECTYYHVSTTDEGTGLVTSSSGPRWDTVKSIKGKINEVIQTAGAAAGDVQEALIEKGYGWIRSWCEVFVEQELLAHVTQRYQPNVMMTTLRDIRADRLDAARNVVVPIYEKACRYIDSHSQPLITLGTRPSLAELKADWKELLDARDAYLK